MKTEKPTGVPAAATEPPPEGIEHAGPQLVKPIGTKDVRVTTTEKLRQEMSGMEYLQAIVEEHWTASHIATTVNAELMPDEEEVYRSVKNLDTEDLEPHPHLAPLTEHQPIDDKELRTVKDDLRKPLNELRIPILILGNNLHTRRFALLAGEAWKWLPADFNRSIHGLRPIVNLADLERLISGTIRTRIPQDCEVRDVDGHSYALSVQPYLTSANKIEGVLITLIDSERTERNFRGAGRRDYSSAIVDTVRQALVVIGPSLRLVAANRSFHEMFQISREEAKNREIFDLVGVDRDNSDLRELLVKILIENTSVEDFKLIQVLPRLGPRTLLLNARRLICEGETSGLILLTMLDVSERESIAVELRENGDRLGELTASLLTGQEEEQRRISRELHDDLDQMVAMLIVEMETLEKGPLRSAASMREHLTSPRTQTEVISNDLRDKAHQLHPSVDHLGLPTALRSLCAEFSRQEKVQVHFRQRNADISIPPKIGLCLYRITQEALRNIVKHSGANNAAVSLLVAKGRILLSIRDCSAGFELAFVGAKKGLGIVSMEERVQLTLGTLAIRSRPLGGTRVAVEVARPKDNL